MEPCTCRITCINRRKLANPDGIPGSDIFLYAVRFVRYNLSTGCVSCKFLRGCPGARTLVLLLVTKWRDFVAASNSLGVGEGHRLSHLTTKSRFTVSCPKRGVQFNSFCSLDSCTFRIAVLCVVFFLLDDSPASKFCVDVSEQPIPSS
jgi:hypothetical protein